jgi:hypothetical protein
MAYTSCSNCLYYAGTLIAVIVELIVLEMLEGSMSGIP